MQTARNAALVAMPLISTEASAAHILSVAASRSSPYTMSTESNDDLHRRIVRRSVLKGSRYRTTMSCSFNRNRYTAMPLGQLVQARVDREIKEEAAAVLAAMGLTVSDAVRLLLTRVAREKALPFAPLVPNAATIAAMKEARAGNLPQFEDVQSLLDDLHADD